MKRKILVGVLAALVIVQFIIPERNISPEILTDGDNSKVRPIPQNVHEVLVRKCYDCHSNNTSYPWYVNIQPIGWWLAHHVNEGKAELNFSLFAAYEKKKADHKLEELGEVITDGSMPLKAYILLHPESKITEDEKRMINEWLDALGVKGH